MKILIIFFTIGACFAGPAPSSKIQPIAAPENHPSHNPNEEKKTQTDASHTHDNAAERDEDTSNDTFHTKIGKLANKKEMKDSSDNTKLNKLERDDDVSDALSLKIGKPSNKKETKDANNDANLSELERDNELFEALNLKIGKLASKKETKDSKYGSNGSEYERDDDTEESMKGIQRKEMNYANRDAVDRDEVVDDVGVADTVVSVQYDRGMIKEVYLSQSKRSRDDAKGWSPSVSDRRRLCSNLCLAGLGGPPCGGRCVDSLSATLTSLRHYHHGTKLWHDHGSPKTARLSTIRESIKEGTDGNNTEEDEPEVGYPRSDVCSSLCRQNLGFPLCDCSSSYEDTSTACEWSAVCTSFCSSKEPYRVPGCAPCKTLAKVAQPASTPPSDSWVQWCRHQCQKGDGGAACNCDKAPFSI